MEIGTGSIQKVNPCGKWLKSFWRKMLNESINFAALDIRGLDIRGQCKNAKARSTDLARTG